MSRSRVLVMGLVLAALVPLEAVLADAENIAGALERRLGEALRFEGKPGNARKGVRVFYLRVRRHKGVALEIHERSGKAYLLLMGRRMLAMTVKPAAGRNPQGNVLELAGNGRADPLYLDKAKRILAFRRGKALEVFATVAIRRTRKGFVATLAKERPIEMLLWTKPGRATVYLARRPFFRMKATATHPPFSQAEFLIALAGNAPGKPTLWFDEPGKRLFFKTGNPVGTFASVAVVKRMTRKQPRE